MEGWGRAVWGKEGWGRGGWGMEGLGMEAWEMEGWGWAGWDLAGLEMVAAAAVSGGGGIREADGELQLRQGARLLQGAAQRMRAHQGGWRRRRGVHIERRARTLAGHASCA